MIIFEFRTPDLFKQAASLLEELKIPCISELSPEPWRPSCLFLFEDSISTTRQREALGRARMLEQEDRRRPERQQLPNLAMPQ
jgi:hypothetical protein